MWLLMVILLMAIGGYWWLLMHIILLVIHGYWWILMDDAPQSS
jgi:hypothetical protein